jgi:U3 small nucleolar RNA-associated protein 10
VSCFILLVLLYVVLTVNASEGDHSLSPSMMGKRRAQALIIFVGFALKPKTVLSAAKDGGAISEVVAQLITFAAGSRVNSPEAKPDDILEAARESLNRLLTSMSVIDFLNSVETILLSGDDKVIHYYCIGTYTEKRDSQLWERFICLVFDC